MPPCRQGNGHWAVGEQCGLRAKAASVSGWLWGFRKEGFRAPGGSSGGEGRLFFVRMSLDAYNENKTFKGITTPQG